MPFQPDISLASMYPCDSSNRIRSVCSWLQCSPGSTLGVVCLARKSSEKASSPHPGLFAARSCNAQADRNTTDAMDTSIEMLVIKPKGLLVLGSKTGRN